MVPRVDPLANPGPLIRRTYAYVAYRIGDGPDAEDVTSTTFERAVRYRNAYDASKGDPLSWLIGIARACVADHLAARGRTTVGDADVTAPGDLESDVVDRLSIGDAVSTLDERDRELIALRFGADMKARDIAALLGMTTNAVEVALHRSRERLRSELTRAGYGERRFRAHVQKAAPEALT